MTEKPDTQNDQAGKDDRPEVTAAQPVSAGKAAGLPAGGGMSSWAAALKRVPAPHFFLALNTLALFLMAFLVLQLSRGDRPAGSEGQPDAKEAEGAADGGPQRAREVPNLSWRAAQAAFASKDYAAALQQYRALFELAEGGLPGDPTADFFKLRIAQCLNALGNPDQAAPLFDATAASKSPAVRAEANYCLAVLARSEGGHLQARTYAYRAASAFATLSGPAGIEADSDFLVARAMTEEALSLYTMESAMEWGSLPERDLFAETDRNSLQELLADGADALGGGAARPAGQARGVAGAGAALDRDLPEVPACRAACRFRRRGQYGRQMDFRGPGGS